MGTILEFASDSQKIRKSLAWVLLAVSVWGNIALLYRVLRVDNLAQSACLIGRLTCLPRLEGADGMHRDYLPTVDLGTGRKQPSWA